MAAVTQAEDRRGVGSLVGHTDGFTDETDVRDVNCKPSARK